MGARWKTRRLFLRSGDGTDLSHFRGPGLSESIAQPVTKRETWESFALTDAQISDFEEKGYVSGIPILSEEECDVLTTEVDSLLTPNHPGNDLFYAYHPLVASGAWR